MDMVGHQAPGINLNLQLPAPVFQCLEVVRVITVIDENGISIVITLNHVMWHIGATTLPILGIANPFCS